MVNFILKRLIMKHTQIQKISREITTAQFSNTHTKLHSNPCKGGLLADFSSPQIGTEACSAFGNVFRSTTC